MCLHKDCSTRSFIDTTGLHTNYTVLYDIDDTDTMLSTETVQFTDDIRNFHFLSVYRCWNTFFESHSYIFAFIRSFLRRNTENKKMIIVWLVSWAFQLQTFVADVP